jgi:intraflagellar transport protein 74
MMPPGTAGMMPPGTGMMPPGTGMMPPGTGMMPPGMGGSVLQQGMKVDERPVTQMGGGGMGMKTAGQGPGRQVFDRSYYIGQLRSKQSELNTEIDRIHTEWDRLQTENASFFKLATRQQTLEEEVKTMQGDLADYNLMVDKSRTNADPEEIEKEYAMAKTKNTAETGAIDSIVTERTQVEGKIRAIEKHIQEHQALVQQKMDELPEDKRELWFKLQEEDSQLTTEMTHLDKRVDEVSQQVRDEEDNLRRDPLKKQALVIMSANAKLEKDKDQLELDTAHLRLSFPEQKKLLLDQVKRDNESIKKMEEEMKALREEIANHRDRLHEMNTDLAENQAGNQEDKQKKMTEQFQKMQDELNNWDVKKLQEQEETKAAQEKVAALLGYSSKLELKAAQIGDAGQHADMQSDLAFKQKEMENSQQTAEKMEQELRKVKEEAEKLAGIDSKIETELSQLNTRKREMAGELDKYSDEMRLRQECEAKQKSLVNQKARLFRQRDTLRSQVQLTNTTFTKQKTELSEDETHNSLQKLTQKLASHEQTIFSLREFVESRTVESNYNPVKEAALQMTGELNQMAQLATRVGC